MSASTASIQIVVEAVELKTKDSRFVIPLPIITEAKGFAEKAADPIEVTLSGIVTKEKNFQ